jgi:RNA-directed DNA polymerase
MSESATATYEWHQLPWRKLEVTVFKLERRIYKASQAGDIRRVHRLQKLLLKSRAAKLLAVRRITQDNQGKNTAGIDGIKALTPHQRGALAAQLGTLPTGRPTRRVWIPKPGKDEQRPLSIPTLHDRALQALVKLVLEPEWEARFEPNSYGFRPGRSVHDAIGAIFIAIEKQPKYALDADIAKCFDRIDQQALLRKIKTFPTLNRLVKAWLQAGVLDNGVFTETTTGTPQGGVASPLLANIALHGLEEFIRSQFPARTRRNPAQPGRQLHWQPQIIRYADDLVILHRDRTVIEQCRRLTQAWLQDIGLELSEQKTRIAHTLEKIEGEAGFNFLGFQVRQYRASKYNTARGRGFKTLITPSQEAVKRHWATLSALISQHKAAQQANLIGILNPIIAGWANYYSAVVSTKTFHLLDHRLYEKLRRWAFFRHPRKSRRWAIQRYWDTTPGKSWAFRDSNGPTLNQHTHVPIVRHVKVQGQASPYDGNWSYWAARRGKYPGVSRRLAALLKKQAGHCEACGLFFTPEALIELHHRDGNRSDNRYINLAVVHRHCHDQIHGGLHELSQQLGTHDKRPFN